MHTTPLDTLEVPELKHAALLDAAHGAVGREEVDASLAPLNYWLPGELTVQPLFFDRLELPHDGDFAP